MGIGPFSNCTGIIYGNRLVNLNPNPANFKIERLMEAENYTYAEVRYPDCKNCEGLKIMVYPGRVAGLLRLASEIDPHFTDGKALSPIARFEPSKEGIALAMMLVQS